MGVFQEPVSLEGVFACRFGVVFHCVVARKLVVEVGGEQFYTRFEIQEASCSLKDFGVQHYVVLVFFPVELDDFRSNFVGCNAILAFVNGDVSAYRW